MILNHYYIILFLPLIKINSTTEIKSPFLPLNKTTSPNLILYPQSAATPPEPSLLTHQKQQLHQSVAAYHQSTEPHLLSLLSLSLATSPNGHRSTNKTPKQPPLPPPTNPSQSHRRPDNTGALLANLTKNHRRCCSIDENNEPNGPNSRQRPSIIDLPPPG